MRGGGGWPTVAAVRFRVPLQLCRRRFNSQGACGTPNKSAVDVRLSYRHASTPRRPFTTPPSLRWARLAIEVRNSSERALEQSPRHFRAAFTA